MFQFLNIHPKYIKNIPLKEGLQQTDWMLFLWQSIRKKQEHSLDQKVESKPKTTCCAVFVWLFLSSTLQIVQILARVAPPNRQKGLVTTHFEKLRTLKKIFKGRQIWNQFNALSKNDDQILHGSFYFSFLKDNY